MPSPDHLAQPRPDFARANCSHPPNDFAPSLRGGEVAGASSGEVAGARLRPVPRLALSLDEAAASLGVSRDYFDEHVRPELRVARRGRRVLIAVTELERWLEQNAARVLDA
jgi:excisionase family DNA binding protein